MLRISAPSANGQVKTQEDLEAVRHRLDKACHEFESVVLKQLLDASASGDSEGGFFGDDAASSTLRHLHSTYLAQAIGDSGGMGIADMLMQRLSAYLKVQTADLGRRTPIDTEPIAGADIS